jgi:ELWxxDGT repeat protein
VFWLQRNDANGANGAGSEIHAVDLTAQNPALTLRVFDLAPGATSGAGEFGEAVYANGRLYFVGSEDGTTGGRALWTVAPDFTLAKVTGPELRDPFGLVERPIVVNGEVFFTAREDAGGFERLFQVNDDGVTATELALPGAPNFIATAHDIGNDIALVAVDASGPFTLGPVQVFRFTPGSQPGLEGAVTQLTNFAEDSDAITDVTLGGDGEIYFVRSIPATGTELWVVDGTVPEGARLLADINADPVPVGYAPEQVVAAPFLI